MVRRRDRTPKPEHGWYRYQNIANGELLLSKPLSTGLYLIPVGAIFEGTSYYQDHYGCKLLANLSQHFKDPKEQVKKKEEQLLVDAPAGDNQMEVFTKDKDGSETIVEGTKSKNANNIDMKKSELIEFAKFKGVEINSNWSKTKILETIRQKS